MKMEEQKQKTTVLTFPYMNIVQHNKNDILSVWFRSCSFQSAYVMLKSPEDDPEEYQGVAMEILKELSIHLNFRYMLWARSVMTIWRLGE